MSFSAEVKNELSRIFSEDEKGKLAELSALVRTTGSLKIVGLNKLAFSIFTENIAVSRKVFKLIKDCFKVNVKIEIKKSVSKTIYNLDISYDQGANEILEKIGIIDIKDGYISFLDNIPKKMLSTEDCKRAFIRGTFLGAASITNPQKLYHMEFSSTDVDSIKRLLKMLLSYNISAKILEKKSVKNKKLYILYIKEAESISDLLKLIGAHKSLLKFEEVRIHKEIMNNVNRQSNCEAANIDRVVLAATRQIKSIDYIIEKKGIKFLPENLQEIAKKRKKYYELDLTDLGKKLKKPLGKSGVNYRLKKIEEIAEKLREALGE